VNQHQNHPHPVQFRQIAALAALAFVLPLGAQTAPAAKEDPATLRLAEMEIVSPRDSAISAAPTESKLDVLQPQSSISLQTIQNSNTPTADYATLVQLAPSVSNVETNGPGLSEAKHTTLRGIDDGGYNVTFDGIPFGDYNTFTHHTTSYFPAKLIGEVVVDRGPGTASTIGNATFGGTMALLSKDPSSKAGFIPTLSWGSWGTKLGHFEVNSGLVDGLGQASAIASYQRMETDGYRTGGDMTRDTYYLKYNQPMSRDTTITLLSSVNKISFGNPSTVTQLQIDTLGRNFGLKPNTPANALDLLNRRYNYQDKTADFEYLGIDSRLGNGWSLENKVYTYSYNNNSHEKPKVGTGTAAGTMLGSVKLNEYRTYGDSFTLAHAGPAGIFKAGFWVDATINHRHTYGVNYDTTGADQIDLTDTALYKAAAPGGNPDTLPGASSYNYSYRLVDHDTTFQPYVEYQWQPTSTLTVNGGLQYTRFTRDFDAKVNQTVGRQALKSNRKDTFAAPKLSANLRLNPFTSVYAQVARGFQSLSEANSFYTDSSNVSKIAVKPQVSTNYQVGTVYRSDRFTGDIDAYYIDFKNYAYKGPTDSSGDPTYYGTAAGAHYSGVEAQGTYFVGAGLSLYANASLNQAKFKGSELDLPIVPNSTGVIGLVYGKGGLFGSFTQKYVGPWTVYNTISNPDIAGGGASRSAKSASYSLGDLSVGYNWKTDSKLVRSVKVRLQVSNLFNKKIQVLDGIDASVVNAYTKDTFNVLPVRNYFLTVSGEF
jgi:iron complex outermembrane receptor protein